MMRAPFESHRQRHLFTASFLAATFLRLSLTEGFNACVQRLGASLNRSSRQSCRNVAFFISQAHECLKYFLPPSQRWAPQLNKHVISGVLSRSVTHLLVATHKTRYRHQAPQHFTPSIKSLFTVRLSPLTLIPDHKVIPKMSQVLRHKQ